MSEFEQKLNYTFARTELLEQALTHKSFRHENGRTLSFDNEKLEFLGDAVLDLALSQYLMEQFPEDKEGALSKKRASLVNEDSLSVVALGLGLDQLLRLGKGERMTGGQQKPRLLASGLEAVIGAVFTDSGFDEASRVIQQLFADRVSQLGSVPDYSTDFKTRLQEVIQEKRRDPPVYRLENESGPDHDKQFEVVVCIDQQPIATGLGRSKKAAEQEAARKALEALSTKESP